MQGPGSRPRRFFLRPELPRSTWCGGIPGKQAGCYPGLEEVAVVRRKLTLYVEDEHIVLMDEILYRMKREAGLRQDYSMLVRALLDQLPAMVATPEGWQALVEACRKTPPIE